MQNNVTSEYMNEQQQNMKIYNDCPCMTDEVSKKANGTPHPNLRGECLFPLLQNNWKN